MLNKNRIIALILAVVLIVPTLAINAFAKTELNNEELMDVKTFRLLEDESKLGEPISRAMFAKLTVRLLNMERIAYQMGSANYYTDVTSQHWANTYINLLHSLEIVAGNGTTGFAPDRTIAYSEALKILVGALGYTIYADQEGGYPVGYSAVAARLGITKGVDATTELTYADAMKLFYNCLDIGIMEQAIPEEEYYVSDVTPRDTLLGNKKVGMVKLRGIVESNYNTYLDSAIPEIEEGEISFYDMLMKAGTSGAENYLGYEIDVYVSTTNGGTYTVETVLPTENNIVTTIGFEDVTGLTESKITYSDDLEDEEIAVEDDAVFVYNGRISDCKTAAKNMKNGSVTVISNDGNKAADVIFIDSYESGVVETINYESKYLVLGANKTINGQKALRFDGTDKTVQFYFRDGDGNKIEPEEIKNGDVVSIYADFDNKLIYVVKGKGSVTGIISEAGGVSSPTITIDGTEYAVENGYSGEIMVGKTVEAFLNFEGKVARIEETDGAVLYGAIVATKQSGLGAAQVKMLIPGAIADETEQAEDPDDEEIVSLVAKNSGIEAYTLSNNINYLGTKMSSEDTKSAIDAIVSGMGYYVVEYKLNSNGEITHIDVPEQVGSPYSKTYNSDERTFGATSGGAFGVCDTTKAICVPSNKGVSDADYMTKIKMSHGRSYYVASYVYNEDTYCVDLIVIREVMVFETTGSISTTSKIALVESVTSKMDENGDAMRYVTLVTDTGKTEKVVSIDTSSKFNFSSLKPGDLICYSLDSLDRLDGAELLVSSDPVPPSRIDNKMYTVYSGFVADAKYNIVSEPLNRWVDILSFTTEDGRENNFEIRQRGTPPIYVYDTKAQTAAQGTTLDFMRSHKRAVVCTKGTTVKAVLIIL
ncbi:MAG: S-layer homology domain-containing protein [Ruminococcaceae bacterium]|nr:S-layer homology domain-containing protein [Oscillospiraceae bacterium]